MNTSPATVLDAAARPQRLPARAMAAPPQPAGRAAEFAEMALAFQRSGGLVQGDQLTTWLRRGSDQPISRLARWIVTRQVLSIDWQGQTWLPLFQFDPEAMALRAGLPALLGELDTVFDAWELGLWFARGNSWLQGDAPADRLARDPQAVWQAARADRYIATGG